jgi:hypothetical protein
MTISRWILLRIRNVLDKLRTENKNTHFMSYIFFRQSCRLWDMTEIMVELDRLPTIWCMRFACRISKVTSSQANAHSHTPTLTPTHAHTHTEMCHTYWFATARMVSWQRLNIATYVHCLSFLAKLLWPKVYDGEYEGYHQLGCDAVYICTQVAMFRGSLLPFFYSENRRGRILINVGKLLMYQKLGVTLRRPKSL